MCCIYLVPKRTFAAKWHKILPKWCSRRSTTRCAMLQVLAVVGVGVFAGHVGVCWYAGVRLLLLSLFALNPSCSTVVDRVLNSEFCLCIHSLLWKNEWIYCIFDISISQMRKFYYRKACVYVIIHYTNRILFNIGLKKDLGVEHTI